MHVERNGLHRWFPVGIIVRGPKDEGNDGAIGAVAEFDMIRLRRIHVIQPDGTIKRESGGWLPV